MFEMAAELPPDPCRRPAPISVQLAELLGGSLKVADSGGSGAIARLVIPFEHQGSDDARS
jgi:hypothetical protein